MKRSFVIVSLLAAIFASGCAGFPAPRTENDSLVIGNLLIDFPDSFFGGDPRLIRNGLRLDFFNNTTGEKLILLTKDGYFKFATNGTDDYILMSYSFEEEADNHVIKMGPVPVKIPIQGNPGKVLYTGHIVVLYKAPDESGITYDGGYSKKSFNYQNEIKIDWKEDEVKAYLRRAGAEDSWGKLPILKTGK